MILHIQRSQQWNNCELDPNGLEAEWYQFHGRVNSQ
jgi:hypothetical protein